MKIRAKGLDEALAKVRRARAALRDMTGPLSVLAEGLRAVIAESFRTSTEASGAAFPRLAPSTLRQKKRARYSPKPLVRRGARGLEGLVAVQVMDKSRVRVSVPASVGYGRYHQLGEGVPRRRFLPFVGVPGGETLMGGAKIARVKQAFEHALRQHVWPEGRVR